MRNTLHQANQKLASSYCCTIFTLCPFVDVVFVFILCCSFYFPPVLFNIHFFVRCPYCLLFQLLFCSSHAVNSLQNEIFHLLYPFGLSLLIEIDICFVVFFQSGYDVKRKYEINDVASLAVET